MYRNSVQLFFVCYSAIVQSFPPGNYPYFCSLFTFQPRSKLFVIEKKLERVYFLRVGLGVGC